MTVLASVAGRKVRRVLTLGFRAIVAGDTVARNAAVIERGRCPCRSLVAILTCIASRKMRRVFTARLGAIMASDAIAGNAAMRKLGAGPAVGRFVAILANVG